MSWSHFSYFAVAAILLWTTGAYAAWRNKPRTAYGATVAGLVVFFAFIVGLWISLERPPLRTMGETRLWYSFFLPLTGIIVYGRWHYKWILSFSTMMALVFVCINLFKPEIHSKTLMPALQSPWFAPHVIVYMFAYALLGASMVMAFYLLFFKGRFKVTERGSVKQPGRYRCGGFRAKLSGTYQPPAPQEMDLTDNLVNGGLACSLAPFGRRRRGGIIGLGTLKRPGQPSHGSAIWVTSTIAVCPSRAFVWRCGC